ncbi:MAG: 4Fe-4S dicluster domain-containing protein [Desulfobacterales bacterium]|nr:MAG: 4Fe-4S dicluster domain-containing protein [Desulfobacterales bacterium]
MPNNTSISTNVLFDLKGKDPSFAAEVKCRSGVDINLCWHCQTCANGCPFSQAMDYAPNRVIRLVQLGFQAEALGCSGIWLCVGCNTCSIQCPNAIDVAAVNDVLREMAIETGVHVAQPQILDFHNEVLNSIERYGRTHKLEIMLRFKFRKRDWFSDFGLGFKMLAKRKLEFLPSRIRDVTQIRNLFQPEADEAAPCKIKI